MANGKWLPDLSPSMPVEKAARHALEVRLGVVRDLLPKAVHEADKDTEHVHQLRVGTRRARAALRIFAPYLPDKMHKALRKALRKLRRAAGDARDWDVFLDMVQKRAARATARQKPGIDLVAGIAVAYRQVAQERLVDSIPSTTDLDELVSATLAAIRPMEKGSCVLLDLAQPVLTELLHDLDRATQEDLDQYDNLHQVRIQGKRLRYAMELFESCFASEFRERYYPDVEAMQDILGEANDSRVADQRLEVVAGQLQSRPAICRRVMPGIEALRRFHQDRLPKQRQLFARRWRAWQKSGAEKAFAAMLKKAGR
jgi:CHAD domain-containing protein